MKKIKENWILFLVIVFSLTPVIWFLGRPNMLVNGVDTNFPLNPSIWFQRRFFVWNSVSNAGQDFSSSIAGTFFHLIQVIPFKLGFGLQMVELISFIFWFTVIVVGAFALSRLIFPKHKFAQAIFVSLYSFNIYLFNSWENVKVSNLSLIASIPLSLCVLILMKDKKISLTKGFFLSLLVGILASGSGINPSYMISLFILVIIFVLSDLAFGRKRNIVLTLKQSGVWLTGIVLINLFWIIPTIYFIFKVVPQTGSLSGIGFTSWVDSLSKNTSIFNVLRMQGAWDWYAVDDSSGQPLYIPYAHNYFKNFPFIVFSLLIPLVSFASLALVNVKKFKYYFFFLSILLLGVFLGIGTHAPTGVIFTFLIKYIPFFDLFRSPWYIFTPMVVLAYAGLVGLFFSRKVKFLNLFAVVLIVGNLIYSYPLVTGKIFRPAKKDGFYVKFPDYVFEAGKWLSEGDGGRVLGYPDDELEQYEWGYRGVESILGLMTDREILFSSFNASNSGASILVSKLYEAIKKDQIIVSESLAKKLNISLLFEKGDQPSLAPKIPESFRQGDLTEFGKWKFYGFSQAQTSKIYSASDFSFGYPFNNAGELVSVVGESHLINPQDSVVKSSSEIVDHAGKIVYAQNSQVNDFKDFLANSTTTAYLFKDWDLTTVVYTFEVPESGEYGPILEKFGHADFEIDLTKPLRVLLDGKPVIWEVESVDDYIRFKPSFVTRGVHKVVIEIGTSNQILSEDFGNTHLELVNKDSESISRNFLLSNFDSRSKYLLKLDYLHAYGENPMIILKQENNSSPLKTQVEKLPNYTEWSSISFFIDPVNTPSKLMILLNAGGATDPKGTKVSYDNLKVLKVFTNKLFFVSKGKSDLLDSPSVSYTKNSPVEYTANVSNAKGTHVLVFAENYSPYWRATVHDEQGGKTSYKPKHFSVDAFANAWIIENPSERYTLKIYYTPQNLYKLGLVASVLSFGVGLFLFLYKKE